MSKRRLSSWEVLHPMTKCAQPFCGHYHSDYDGVCMSKGCTCTPELFIAVDPKDPGYQSFAYRQKIIASMSDLEQKLTWLLEAVPETRNLANWPRLLHVWRYFFGYNIGDPITQELADKIGEFAEPENVRRCFQKICSGELETLRIFQSLLQELAKEGRDGRQEYWKLTEQMKQFWMNSKYIPNDFALLRRKGIKESAIFEWSIPELNAIC